jgi:beta-galactosidase
MCARTQPAWLIREDPAMKIRTYDPSYIKYVDEWFSVLLPMVLPLLWVNGGAGPVLMVQVENEYGWSDTCCDASAEPPAGRDVCDPPRRALTDRVCPCRGSLVRGGPLRFGNTESSVDDRRYIQHLFDRTRQWLGPKVVIWTTDGAVKIKAGGLQNQTLLTPDFGPTEDATAAFEAELAANPDGWRVRWNSEYHPSHVVLWGDAGLGNLSAITLAETLDTMMSEQGSVSFYVGVGGTDFGASARRCAKRATLSL